ncbi:MAG: hypothetical protein AAF915_24290 [Cyanobacteria bacterium P01_D01_bin.50]
MIDCILLDKSIFSGTAKTIANGGISVLEAVGADRVRTRMHGENRI